MLNSRNDLEELNVMLPDGIDIEKQKEMSAIELMKNAYIPSAVLRFKEQPFAVVEFINWSDRSYVKSILFSARIYCKENLLDFILLVDSHKAFVLSVLDDFQQYKEMSINDALACLYKRISEIQNIDNESWMFVKESVESIIKEIKCLDPSVKERLLSLDWSSVEQQYIYSKTPTSIFLPVEMERSLFMALLGGYYESRVCRYATRETLYRIISTKKQSLCCVVGMNDKSECSYVDNYFAWKYGLETQYGSSFSSSQNDYYITSCRRMDCDNDSRSDDNLSMWRMYADDCKGVCMVYKVNKNIMEQGGYVFAPVSYAKYKSYFDADDDGIKISRNRLEKIHPELDFLHKFLQIRIAGYDVRIKNLELWKHFFKDAEYSDEREVRLLYKSNIKDTKKWILANNIFCPIVEKSITSNMNEFPLQLEKVILGSKFAEQRINTVQIEQMILDSDIVGSLSVECVSSEINNYR